MTAVVGLRTPRSIIVAADSAICDEDSDTTWLTAGKIRRVGNIVAAGAGDAAVTSAFLASLTPKDEKLSPQRLAERLLDLVEDRDRESSFSNVVVALGGDLWVLDTTGAFDRPSQNYVAVGSGAKAAMGALFALAFEHNPCFEDARTAVSAAASCCEGVRLPAIVMEVRR